MSQSFTVLIVEDDELLRDALAARVITAGFHPVSCADRVSAIALAADCAVAIVDLGLPPKPHLPEEGLLLVQSLALQYPELTIVVQSGQDEEHASFAALSSGAWDFLSKPVSPAVFDSSLQRAVRRSSISQQLARQGRIMPGGPAFDVRGLKDVSDAAQERLLRQTLAMTQYNVTESSRRLGMPRERLYYYLDKFGIRRPDAS
jgi:two-component system response regulator RegA